MNLETFVFHVRNLNEGIGLEESAKFIKDNRDTLRNFDRVRSIKEIRLIDFQNEKKVAREFEAKPNKKKPRNEKDKILRSAKWKALRKEIISEQGRACLKCGSTPDLKNLHIDHIKPFKKYPELAFCKDNLQVLCKRCNFAKSFIDETDYRKAA